MMEYYLKNDVIAQHKQLPLNSKAYSCNNGVHNNTASCDIAYTDNLIYEES